MTRRLALLLALLAARPAMADPAPPTPGKVERPVQTLGKDDPECAEWSDGCIVCRKSADGAIACSTPGAACVPREPSCAPRAR